MRARACSAMPSCCRTTTCSAPLDGTPVYEASADLRLMFRDEYAIWHLNAALMTLYEVGDQFAFISNPQDTLDQTPRNDRLRYMDLTWTLEDGPRHETVQRFDRLAVEYRAEHWGVTIGRDAVSWGGGIVFQPLDIFAPFAPTTVDRDYKPGEDLVKIDGVTEHGSDWQLLGVFRREHRKAIAPRRSIRSAANGTACSATTRSNCSARSTIGIASSV